MKKDEITIKFSYQVTEEESTWSQPRIKKTNKIRKL